MVWKFQMASAHIGRTASAPQVRRRAQARDTWPQSQAVEFPVDSLDELPRERPHVLSSRERKQHEMKKSAKAFLAEIEQNVDAYFAEQIDSATFGARQRAVWDEIVAAGSRIRNAVVRHLREQLPPVSGGSR